MTNQRVLMRSRPQGRVTEDHFQLVEGDMPRPAAGMTAFMFSLRSREPRFVSAIRALGLPPSRAAFYWEPAERSMGPTLVLGFRYSPPGPALRSWSPSQAIRLAPEVMCEIQGGRLNVVSTNRIRMT